MIIDHIGLHVSDIERSRNFYIQALKPLEIELVMEVQGRVALGRDQKPEFWLAPAGDGQINAPLHLAFRARSRAQVDEFYRAAIAAGAADNSPPGPRPIYHENYYGAFVLDPDGHNIEAVCHLPPA